MVTAASGACALCAHPATIADWAPIQAWLAVEGCPCGDFFVWADVWTVRVRRMTAAERGALATRVRDWRAGGREAWLSTADSTVAGPLVIFPERPATTASPQP